MSRITTSFTFFFLFFVIIIITLSNYVFGRISTVKASMREKGYQSTVGGGSLADPLWIDLMSVIEITNHDPNLSELSKLYDVTEIGFKLEQSRHITVFMPNNQAVQNQLANALPNLSYVKLIEILKGHILPEIVKISELQKGSKVHVKPMDSSESELIIEIESFPPYRAKLYFENSKIVAFVEGTEIDNANGVGYIIDNVLLTPDMEKLILEKSSNKNHSIESRHEHAAITSYPDAPNYIQQTNLRHWFYGRYVNPSNSHNSDSRHHLDSHHSNPFNPSTYPLANIHDPNFFDGPNAHDPDNIDHRGHLGAIPTNRNASAFLSIPKPSFFKSFNNTHQTDGNTPIGLLPASAIT